MKTKSAPEKTETAPLTAAILTTGSEIVLGRMVDTNSAWLSSHLAALGVNVLAHESRGDDLDALVALIGGVLGRFDVVLMTGGLGPTEDDLTRLAVSKVLGTPLRFHADLAERLRGLFERRGYPLTPNQMRQAWLPEGTGLVVNDYGTAPAFAIERAGTLALMLPGVPDEMRTIVSSFLAPRLRELFPGRLGVVRTTILLAGGLGEGLVDHRLADLLSSSVNPKLGLLAGVYETRILVTTKGRDESECDRLEAPILEEIHRRLGDNLVGRGQDGLSSTIGRLLSERRSRLAVVDTATGGRLAERLRPSLRAGTLAGALTVGPERLEAALELAVSALGADIVALVTALPNGPPAADGHLDLIGGFRIIAPGPDGENLTTGGEAKVAGPPDLALDRLASLAAWHLWRRLTGRDDPAAATTGNKRGAKTKGSRRRL